MARGYLLPSGCKDLIDVLNLKRSQPASLSLTHMIDFSKLKTKLSPQQFNQLFKALQNLKPQFLKFDPAKPISKPSTSLPPIVGQIVIPPETSVSQLAALLGQKPFQIVADVLELGFFVAFKDPLSFEIISSVARKHGFLAIKAAL